MLECALILPVLILLLLLIVEISRYWAVQGVLNQGAQRGLNLAIRMTDLQHEGTADPLKFEKFLVARQRIIQEAERLASASFVKGHAMLNSPAHFTGFRDYQLPGGVEGVVNAALLRPGECFRDMKDVLHCHPTLCPPEGQECSNPAGTARRRLSDRMDKLLDSYPLAVIIPVEYRTLVPIVGLGELRPSGIAIGYREIARTGAYPIPEEVDPPFQSTATPTATPTRDGSDPVDPTPAPTSTPTPVPPHCPRPAPNNCGATCPQCINPPDWECGGPCEGE